MKISYNWLKAYLDMDVPVDELSTILTDLGLEVEGIETFQSVKGGLEGLVVGKVISCAKHPNADKLSVTTVDIGQPDVLPIVCGAPNVAAGQKVVVAPVGTTLHAGKEKFEIKKAKIRGEVSQGMICAEDEIGMGTSHDGIIVLPDELVPGTPLTEHFYVEKDTVFEIGLTPNRIDGASHIGTARDLVAFFKQKRDITLNKPSVEGFKVESNELPIKVTIEDTENCKRYAGVSIAGVTLKPSPDWLKNRLKAIGLNPINNVVDVTNFVLHETGQPLHAFDADKLRGKQIIVKRLAEGAKFTTLDEQEHKLSAEDMMICDGEGPVAMAGIFGGMDSGVTESTTNIFLESAYFNPVSVRKTAKRHGLSTDSSFRFERGVDPNNTIYAMKRAALLIKELAGGTIASEVVDEYPEAVPNFFVEVRYSAINRLIGKELEKAVIKNILESLEIKLLSEEADLLKLEVPAYRVDVTREADVIEEILRVYGYNNIEFSEKIKASLSYSRKPEKNKLQNIVSNMLSSKGYNEIMSNSLTKGAYYNDLNQYAASQSVEMLNPLSADMNVMRQTLLFGGLEAIQYNINRQHPNLQLYEFGFCYKKGDEASDDVTKKYDEQEHLGLFVSGDKTSLQWNAPEEKATFFTLKSAADKVLERLGIDSLGIKSEESSNELFAYGLKYTCNDKPVLEMGMVAPTFCKKFEIDQEVFFADIHWTEVVNLTTKVTVAFEGLPKYPAVKRDFALLLDKNITYSQIEELAYKTEKKLLKEVNLFDVFEGEKIGAGKKSYGVSFTLQDESKTLTDQQIDKVMQKLQQTYEKELGASLR
ncbi:MAG: phenylalanine--tRNA ligase subunit beta [Bacteroidota bacterium]